jgi:soluble lytic murein transglycosylase-like protein
MAVSVNIQVPATNAAFYSKVEADSALSKTLAFYAANKAMIDHICRITNMDVKILMSVMWIESNCNPNAYNSGSKATGLMQITPNTPTDMVFLENKRGRLSQPEKDLLRKHIGNRLDTILKMRYYNQYGPQFNAQELFTPELNILLGAIIFGLCMDEETYSGKVRLDRAIIRYNRGWFTKIADGNTDTLLFIYKGETAAYITKFVGVNGILTKMRSTV